MRASLLHTLLFGALLLSAVPLGARADEYDDDLDEPDAPSDEAPSEESGVLVLTASNFASTIQRNPFVLAEFYAPWCGHCKKLAPEYAKAAVMLKQRGVNNVILGKVDATKESALAQEHGIRGYPTMKWFVDGKATEYNGPRDANGIVNWVLKKSGPPTVNVEAPSQLQELEKENEVLTVGYFKEQQGEEPEAFRKLGQSAEDVTFVETSNADVAKSAGLTSPGFTVVKNFKGEPRETAVYSGKGVSNLKDFITAEKLPLTIEFTAQNADKIFNSGINKQVILWAKPADLADESPVFKAYKETAKKMKGQLVFVTVDNEGPTHGPVTKYFGLTDAKSPQVIGFFMDENKKYRLQEEVTEASLMKFCQGVVEGTAPQEFKSQPPPEKPTDEDGVTTVVGKTVDDIVKDPTKDVLLEIYAGYCGHCKALEPTYKKLGKRFKKIDSVVIAKMEGTENEHPDISYTGFPTIMMFPAEKDAKPVQFQGGDRSLKTLTKFIKEHAKVPYELPKKQDGEKDDPKDEL